MMIPKIRLGKPADNVVALFFLAPFAAVFLTFLVWPILYSFLLSFQNQASGYSLESPEFVGLANFSRLMADSEFWWALGITLYYAVLIIPTGIFAALFLALLLNNKLKGVSLYRSAYFLPNVLDMLVIGTIWTLIYSKDGIFQKIVEACHKVLAYPALHNFAAAPGKALLALGLRGLLLAGVLGLLYTVTREYYEAYLRNRRPGMANATLAAGGLVAFVLLFVKGGLLGWFEAALAPAVGSGVLGNPVTVMPAVVFALVVKGAGFGMILFLAAIQNISESVYEAADIDGASAVQKFFFITLPLVKPVILFMIITGITGALNAFTEIYAMTKGGPIVNIGGQALGATKLTGYYLFTKWEQSEYGYAAAISYALLVLTLIISVINARIFRSEEA